MAVPIHVPPFGSNPYPTYIPLYGAQNMTCPFANGILRGSGRLEITNRLFYFETMIDVDWRDDATIDLFSHKKIECTLKPKQKAN